MSDKTSGSGSTSCGSGVGLGSLVAAFISWQINHSIGWLIVHAIFGWAYVIYWALGCAGEIPL